MRRAPKVHEDPTSESQATRIINKFGGPRALAKALAELPDPKDHRHWSVIYRWPLPRAKNGRGGIVPSEAWAGILKAARMHGIYLTEDDMSPRDREVA